MPETDFTIDPTGFSLFGLGDQSGFSLDPSMFNLFGAETSGFDLSGLADQFFFDTQTGQTFSGAQILNDPTLSLDFTRQFATPLGASVLPGGNVVNTPSGSALPAAPTTTDLQRQLLQLQIQRMTPQQNQGFSFTNPDGSINWGTVAAVTGVALPTLLGVGGLIQGLSSGGQSATTVNQPTQSPTAQAAQQAALQGFQGAQEYAFGGIPAVGQIPAGGVFGASAAPTFGQTPSIGGTSGGLAGQLQTMAPLQQQSTLGAIQGLMSQMQTNPFLTGGLQGQLAQQVQGFGGAQAPLLNMAGIGATQLGPSPYTQQFLNQIQGTSPLGVNPASQALTAQAQGLAQNPPQPGSQVGQALGQLQGLSTPGPSPYTQSFLNQVPGLPNQMTPPGVLGSLQGQALGMSQGNLPALDPALREQVRQIFLGPQQDINRYLDQALQGALERARQQGFAGGTEVFREGTPAALLAPGLAEAQRQQGTLAGQEAAAVLALAQSLPQQGGALATTAGNLAQQNLAAQQSNIGLGLTGAQQLFGQQATRSQLEQALAALRLQGAQVPFQQALQSGQQQQAALGLGMQGAQNVFGQQATANQLQQALMALGLQGAQNQFQQGLSANQNLQQAAQGYTTPMSVALGGGLNLSNLNQNIISQLGAYGQQGMGNQLDFLRAISAPLSGLSGLSGAAQAGAGSTSTQTQPFNLLSAFAPTASLLGGVGGALTGLGALSNPATVRV